MPNSIRAFHITDMASLYKICLQTGDNGEDATGMVDNAILGHIYAAPYAFLEPELCLIQLVDGVPSGYILGTADSKQFSERTEASWWGPLRDAYRPPAAGDSTRQAELLQAIMDGYQYPKGLVDEYPAHLHIDLLPIAQGKGHGIRLMEQFIEGLRSRGVLGVHLGVSAKNERATRWYPRFGFEALMQNEGGTLYGMKL